MGWRLCPWGKKMRVAVYQSLSPMGDSAAACAQAEVALRAAGAMGASVLVLPEVWLPGYNQPDIPAQAIAAGSAPLRRLAAAAKASGCALITGYAEAAEGAVWNAALCIDAAGQVVANYRKIQLYGAREQSLYRPGTGYVTFDLAGRKAAILICYDIEFAPHVKALADQGVSLICVPTANMAPFTHVVRHTVPAMAANHGVAIAYANYCGTEGDLTYVGGSQIVGPHGEVLAVAGDGTALLVADIPDVDTARVSTQSRDPKRL
jgi:5-aminopentanamidase